MILMQSSLGHDLSIFYSCNELIIYYFNLYLSTRRDHNDYIDFWSKKKVKNYIIFF